MSSGRLIIAVIIALMAIVTYFSSTSENLLTGEKQRVAMSPEQEIALGYKSAPQMAAQMGGLSQNEKAQALVKQLGQVSSARASPRRALQVQLRARRSAHGERLRVAGRPDFHYRGLLRLLTSKPSSPACSAMRSATSSPAIPPSASPSSSSRGTAGRAGRRQRRLHHAQIGQVVGSMINMSYGREDELELIRSACASWPRRATTRAR